MRSDHDRSDHKLFPWCSSDNLPGSSGWTPHTFFKEKSRGEESSKESSQEGNEEEGRQEEGDQEGVRRMPRRAVEKSAALLFCAMVICH
jgi:hypothetical protein